jgi:hypothetical protein
MQLLLLLWLCVASTKTRKIAMVGGVVEGKKKKWEWPTDQPRDHPGR